MLRTIHLGNDGPMMVSTSPVNKGELGTYNRNDTLGLFISRAPLVWKWQFAQGQVPAPLPRCRLLIDGEPVTDWLPATTTTGSYSFPFTPQNGHWLAHVEAEGLPILCLAVAFVCNDTGAPLPTQEPWSIVNRYEAKGGVGNVAVKFRYAPATPVVRPFKPREIIQSSDAGRKEDWWVRHQTANFGGIVRRWALTPTGDVCVEHDQKYFHGNAITAADDKKQALPIITVRDGPRGVGTLGFVADILVREGNLGAYFLETNGRMGLLTAEGRVITEMGLRLKPGALKVHSGVLSNVYMHRLNAAHRASYAAPWEQYADWSQVSGPHELFEPWGMATARRRADGSINLHDGHEFWVCDTRNDRIVFLDHWTAHSAQGWEPAHYPPANYVQAPGPTGTSTACDFVLPGDACQEPWKCRINPVDGKLYWTNFAGNSIARANLDGTGVEVVLRCSAQPTNAQLGVKSRLARGATPSVLRQSYLRDGPAGEATCVRPTGIDIDSEGNVIFVEHYTYAIRKLDLKTMTVTTIATMLNNNGGSDSSGNREPNIVVDRDGTCGPVDDIFCHAWANNTDRRYGKDGTPRAGWAQWQFQSGERMLNGPLSRANNATYGWGIGVGSGRAISTGNGAGSQYLELTRRLPTDPTPDVSRWERGQTAWRSAGSLHVVHGPSGQGELGFDRFDTLALLSDGELDALLMMHGVPAKDLEDVRYFLRWNAVDLA